MYNMSECVCCFVCGGGGYDSWEGWGLRDRWWVNFGGGRSVLYHGGKKLQCGADFARGSRLLTECIFEFSEFFTCGY